MINKKKILIVTPYGFNDRLANFMEFISARLLEKNDWQVTALTRQQEKTIELDSYKGIIIKRYKSLGQGIFLLLQILFLSRPDVIHVYHLRNNRLGALSGILSKFLAISLIFTEYGLLHDHYLVDDRDDPLGKPLKPNGIIIDLKQLFNEIFSKHGAPPISSFKNYFYHWSLTHADQVIFVSKHNFDLVTELGLKNCRYLPYFFDDDRWQINRELNPEDDRQLMNLKKIENLNSPLVLFVGQLKLRKGWDIYLEAIRFVDKNIVPSFVLVTPTCKELPPNLVDLIKKLGIEERVIFFGQISEQLLKKIYDLSSIVAIPSRYEGFGLVAVEAFAANKPLVASAVPALTETITDDYDGLLVSPKNPEKLAQAIIKLAGDKKLREKLVSGGQTTLKKLKSDKIKKQWLEFYDKIIKNKCT
ncbi:MAG: glycosyltransferase family 4 protein [Candidatus Zambryskibacteria bacterium]